MVTELSEPLRNMYSALYEPANAEALENGCTGLAKDSAVPLNPVLGAPEKDCGAFGIYNRHTTWIGGVEDMWGL